MAQNDNQKRRGAPFGNRRAWKHGRRSAEAVLRRRETRAVLKLAAHLLRACTSLERLRPRPVRADQWAILAERHPDSIDIAVSVGVDIDPRTNVHRAKIKRRTPAA
jgi:hypothetical protein